MPNTIYISKESPFSTPPLHKNHLCIATDSFITLFAALKIEKKYNGVS